MIYFMQCVHGCCRSNNMRYALLTAWSPVSKFRRMNFTKLIVLRDQNLLYIWRWLNCFKKQLKFQSVLWETALYYTLELPSHIAYSLRTISVWDFQCFPLPGMGKALITDAANESRFMWRTWAFPSKFIGRIYMFHSYGIFLIWSLAYERASQIYHFYFCTGCLISSQPRRQLRETDRQMDCVANGQRCHTVPALKSGLLSNNYITSCPCW